MIVDYIETNRYSERYYGRGDLASFLDIPDDQVDDEAFAEYISYMRRPTAYGDHLTLIGAAELFELRIEVVSTGLGSHTIELPQGGDTIYLGHLSEDHGIHYMSIEPNEVDFNVLPPDPPQHVANTEVDSESGDEGFEDFVRQVLLHARI